MDFVKQLDLSRLPRCGQQWEQMQPVEGGRLCCQCDRVIVDFRKSSPGEIAEQMLFANQPVCGVYTPEQLAKPERPVHADRKSTFPPLVAATMALFSMQDLQATPLTNTPPTVQTEAVSDTTGTRAEAQPQDSVQVTRMISGRVIDARTGEPLAFAAIRVVNREAGVSADFDGYFTLDLSDLNARITHVDLECRYVGYQSKIVSGVEIDAEESLIIKLSDADIEMVAFGVTIGEPPKPTLWQRLTRPFRKK
jgi:hypothetical protein